MTPEKAIEVAIALHPVTRNGQTEPLTAAVLAALVEQGYVIVRAEDIRGVLGPKRGVRAYIEAGRRLLDSAEHPAQPPGTLQDASEIGPGISGCSDDPKGAASLSEPQPWKGNAVVLIDGQEIPVRADLTIQPAAWSVDAHLNPADGLYLPLGSCVVRLPDGREGSAYVTSVQNGVCGSLSGVGPPPTLKSLPAPSTEEKTHG